MELAAAMVELVVAMVALAVDVERAGLADATVGVLSRSCIGATVWLSGNTSVSRSVRGTPR